MLTTFPQCNFSQELREILVYAIVDDVRPGLPKQCTVGYSLPCPIKSIMH